ncbi:LysR family transcriptional repressor of citA [Bacillus ectoiniformans]|uniref:LysR family transcriptional regulator n=1 Tax=Bacillus ectoiniformans TaxID=1494429 RepID=UPI0019566F5C|nr:LysR family transcriptional regulator [Bacillus ectoiniformans]MBM7650235.1 LysR family transcriptional repressor of citA [Bacillus ectoiniformans]
MDVRCLRTFLTAAKYENFRKASDEMFLTQPAITKQIRRLEEHLGIKLFNRKGKTVTLTPAGLKFLPHAKEIVTKYDEGLKDFESWKQGYNQKLVIATAPQIASSFLPSLLRTFIDKHPGIELIINVVKSYEIGQEISLSKADLGLTRILPIQSNIKSEILHEENVILVAPNECKGDEKAILQKYRLITNNHPDYWNNLLIDVKRYYPNIQTMTVDQVEVTKRFIEEGLGVSYLPYTMVKDEISKNRLIEIKPDKIIPPKSFTYVLTKVETDEVVLFLQFLKEAITKF